MASRESSLGEEDNSLVSPQQSEEEDVDAETSYEDHRGGDRDGDGHEEGDEAEMDQQFGSMTAAELASVGPHEEGLWSLGEVDLISHLGDMTAATTPTGRPEGLRRGTGLSIRFMDTGITSDLSHTDPLRGDNLSSDSLGLRYSAGVDEGLRDAFTTSLFGDYSLPSRDASFNMSFWDGEKVPEERRVKRFIANTGLMSEAAFFLPEEEMLRCDMCTSEGLRLTTYGYSEKDLQESNALCRSCSRPLSVTVNRQLAVEAARIRKIAAGRERAQKREKAEADKERARMKRMKQRSTLAPPPDTPEEEGRKRKEALLRASGENDTAEQRTLKDHRVLDANTATIRRGRRASVVEEHGGSNSGQSPNVKAHNVMGSDGSPTAGMRRQASADLKNRKREAVKEAFHMHANGRRPRPRLPPPVPLSHGWMSTCDILFSGAPGGSSLR